MAEQKGIDGLKAIMKGATTLTNIGFEAMADGKIGIEDAGLLLKLVPVMGPIFQLGSDVPAEVSDLSEAETAELVAYGISELQIPEAKVMGVVAASLKLAQAGYGLYTAIQAAVQPAAPAAPVA